MECHKRPWKQRGTVLSNAIYPRRQSPSKLQASKPPPMVLLQYFMIMKSFSSSFRGGNNQRSRRRDHYEQLVLVLSLTNLPAHKGIVERFEKSNWQRL